MLFLTKTTRWTISGESYPASGPITSNRHHLHIVWNSVRLLVVEDDPKLSSLLRRALVEEGFVVDTAADGTTALELASYSEYAAIVLDVMLPGIDGFEICRRLRRRGNWSPILMLTARSDTLDRIEGLDAGADDYLTKPFSVAELSARLRALLRRGQPVRPSVLSVGSLSLDPASREVFIDGEFVQQCLTPREFSLLELLMRHQGQVLSRTQILDQLWQSDAEWVSNVVDQTVKYLRRKIDSPGKKSVIETVRGVGYRLGHNSGSDPRWR